MRLAGNVVDTLTGGQGGVGHGDARAHGGSAIGLSVVASTDVDVDGAGLDENDARKAIRSVTGGATRSSTPLGRGGTATGLQFIRVDQLDVADVVLSRLTGGPASRHASGTPVDGGTALGIILRETTGASFRRTRIEDLLGGAGVSGGLRGPRYGVSLDEASSGLLIDTSNTVEGQPLFVADGLEGVEVTGLVLDVDVSATNLGQIVVRRSRDVIIANNRIAGLTGNPGQSGAHDYHGRGSEGVPAVGIRLVETRGDSVVSGNVVEELRGGRGGGQVDGAGRPGGQAIAILMDDCVSVSLRGNDVRRILGGEGGVGGTRGEALGVLVQGGNLQAANNLVASVDGEVATGLSLVGVRLAEVVRTTFADVSGTGLAISGEVQSVFVADSIFALADASVSYTGEDGERVTVDYCNFDRAVPPENMVVGEHNLAANTRFTSEFAGDYSLQPGSPCVDAGDPASDCGLEPRGDGDSCRADMGHLAGTASARAR